MGELCGAQNIVEQILFFKYFEVNHDNQWSVKIEFAVRIILIGSKMKDYLSLKLSL